MMPQTQTHQQLKKNLDMLMLDDMQPVPSHPSLTLTQSNGANGQPYSNLIAQ